MVNEEVAAYLQANSGSPEKVAALKAAYEKEGLKGLYMKLMDRDDKTKRKWTQLFRRCIAQGSDKTIKQSHCYVTPTGSTVMGCNF
jgi:hypothetical protein